MTTPFVGRSRELELLEADLVSALAGQGRLSLIVGEPGIGKTRLADRIATVAGHRGAEVYWGRCWQGGGAPAFWPWVQVLRSCLKTPLAPEEEAAIAWAVSDIMPLVAPAAAGAAAAVSASASRDSEQARFRLFDAVVSFLHAHARRCPLVLVLDDLHDADEPSLLLLNFLARDLRRCPIFLVATCRDAEVRRSPILAAAFAALANESRRLALQGLERGEVGAFIDSLSTHALGPEIKDAVCSMTEGNPFYVDEVVHVLLSRPDQTRRNVAGLGGKGLIHQGPGRLDIPDTVREAIRQRLAPVAGPVRALLEAAATLGRDFETGLVARLAALPLARCEALLEEAAAAGLVEATDTERRHWRFVHVLIRDTLHEDAPEAEVLAFHLRIAELIAEDRSRGLPVRAATLAYHLVEAGPLADSASVLAALLDAGREAVSLLAYEEAARYFALAVDIREQSRQTGHEDAEELAEVVLELAHARRWSGEQVKARELFGRVADLLRPYSSEARARELFVRAVLGCGRVSETGRIDTVLVALLEEALVVVGDGDSQLRSSLLARLAMALYFSPEADARLDFSQRAVAMAERLDDPRARINALVAHHFILWGPDTASERLRVADSVIELCDASGERELVLEARLWRITDLIELGEVAAADAEHRRYLLAAEAARLPTYRWHAALLRSTFALLEGRLDAAQTEADNALAIGIRADTPNARVFHLAQMFRLRCVDGRVAELEPFLRQVADALPSMPVWASCVAEAYLAAGRTDEARREYSRLAADGFAAMPRDGMWLPSLAILSRVASGLGDREGAACLHDLFVPYQDRWVVSAAAIAVSGPVRLFLGLVCATLGKREAAVRHLQAAAELSRGLGYRTLVEECEAELARLDSPGAEAAPSRSDGIERRPATSAVFYREADFWTLALDGPALRLRDSKGMRYIHHLLENAEREFHIVDLVAAVEGGITSRTSSGFDEALSAGSEGDTGPLVDAAARSAYKRRLRELETELAEAGGDEARSEGLKAELEFLSRELAGAVGLGGRERRGGSQAEQERVRVTKVIGLALRRIADADPALGRRLSDEVHTGAFCVYRGDPDRPVVWQTCQKTGA